MNNTKSYIATLLLLVLSIFSCTDEYPDGGVVSDIPCHFIIDKEFADGISYTSVAHEKSITIDVKNIHWVAECNAAWVKLEKIDETILNVSISENSIADIREAVITFKNVDTGALLKELPMSQFGYHESVDLGLPSGVKWATCNVGASKPEDYGDYYAWGEIETKSEYITDNSLTCGDTIENIAGNAQYDVACAKWGDKWHLPTSAEYDELMINCNWSWETQNGVNGYKVTSKHNGNSIFLPAAGFYEATSLDGKGLFGLYTSSDPMDNNASDVAFALYFSNYGFGMDSYSRVGGQSVRPVFGDVKDVSEVDYYQVSVSCNAGGSVEIVGSTLNSRAFPAGTKLSVIATPAEGSNFIGWFAGDSETPVSTEETYEFTVSDNFELRAEFERIIVAEAVDLGLPSGIKWATCNVGAMSPDAYGAYYAWGEIEEKSIYSSNTCKTYGLSMDDISGNAKYDVARALWGGSWRMPTCNELRELEDNCTWTWTTQNGVYGSRVTGPNGNSIFLPAAGYYSGGNRYATGSYGHYWSSTPYWSGNTYAYRLELSDDYIGTYFYDRYYGRSVRPVCDKEEVRNVSISSIGGGSFDIKDFAETVTTFPVGSVVAVTATPDEGCKFIGWFVGKSETPVSTEATYEFTVKEDITLVAKFEEEIITETEKINGYEAVDLGLPSGLKWATCNVGASKPEEYGDYYAWGEIETKSEYSWSTYKWCNGSEYSMTKYCTDSSYGTVDNKTVLDPEDDVAHVKWGGSWRMPTEAEQDELRNNCTWTWTTQNGVSGNKVTGPNGNSIFLPAAGYRGTYLSYRDYSGYYWSSLLDNGIDYNACYFYFNDYIGDWGRNNRYVGLSVRPVSE